MGKILQPFDGCADGTTPNIRQQTPHDNPACIREGIPTASGTIDLAQRVLDEMSPF
jgi:hypothetical protein